MFKYTFFTTHPPNILKIKINDIINHSKYIYIDDISEEEMYYNNYTLSHYIYVHDYKSIFKKNGAILLWSMNHPTSQRRTCMLFKTGN